MLRIETTREGPNLLVHIDGDLEGEGVAELERVVREVTEPLTLELTDLAHADAQGLEAIRKLESGGAELRGTSRFIELLLARSKPSFPATTPTTRPEEPPAEDE